MSASADYYHTLGGYKNTIEPPFFWFIDIAETFLFGSARAHLRLMMRILPGPGSPSPPVNTMISSFT